MSFQIFHLVDSRFGEGLLLEEYKGNFGIYAAGKSVKDGVAYKDWAFPQKRVDGQNVPGEKAIPMGIKLGDRREAIKVLKYFLEQLNASEEGAPF